MRLNTITVLSVIAVLSSTSFAKENKEVPKHTTFIVGKSYSTNINVNYSVADVVITGISSSCIPADPSKWGSGYLVTTDDKGNTVPVDQFKYTTKSDGLLSPHFAFVPTGTDADTFKCTVTYNEHYKMSDDDEKRTLNFEVTTNGPEGEFQSLTVNIPYTDDGKSYFQPISSNNTVTNWQDPINIVMRPYNAITFFGATKEYLDDIDRNVLSYEPNYPLDVKCKDGQEFSIDYGKQSSDSDWQPPFLAKGAVNELQSWDLEDPYANDGKGASLLGNTPYNHSMGNIRYLGFNGPTTCHVYTKSGNDTGLEYTIGSLSNANSRAIPTSVSISDVTKSLGFSRQGDAKQISYINFTDKKSTENSAIKNVFHVGLLSYGLAAPQSSPIVPVIPFIRNAWLFNSLHGNYHPESVIKQGINYAVLQDENSKVSSVYFEVNNPLDKFVNATSSYAVYNPKHSDWFSDHYDYFNTTSNNVVSYPILNITVRGKNDLHSNDVMMLSVNRAYNAPTGVEIRTSHYTCQMNDDGTLKEGPCKFVDGESDYKVPYVKSALKRSDNAGYSYISYKDGQEHYNYFSTYLDDPYAPDEDSDASNPSHIKHISALYIPE